MKNISLLIILSLLFSCSQEEKQQDETADTPKMEGLIERVLSAEEQAALTPEDVITVLKQGNDRFMNNAMT